MVHGEAWTIKEFFVYPNEYIYWTIQIVMYPFMTGLVAGAFVLSSLYHVFGVKQLKEIARFSLVFSFALLPVRHAAADAAPAAAAAGDRGHDDPALHLGHRRLRHRLHHLRHDRRIGTLVRLPRLFRGDGPDLCEIRATALSGRASAAPSTRSSPWVPGTSAAKPWKRTSGQ